LSTRDAVARDTPAVSATCCRVTGPGSVLATLDLLAATYVP
jgi:hypothetical protein